MWWCSYASESACLIVVVHTLRYLVLQPTDVRPVLCYVCVRTLTLRLNIMACITPGLHMGTAMHVCAHARLWQRLCCDTMYPHVLCVCVLVCAPFPCHAPFYRTLHTPSSMHPYHPPTHRSSPPIPTPPIPTPLSPPPTHPFYCTLHTPFRHAPLPHPPTATFTLQQQFILIVGLGAGDKCLATSNAF